MVEVQACRCSQVVVGQRWSLTQVWLYSSSTFINPSYFSIRFEPCCPSIAKLSERSEPSTGARPASSRLTTASSPPTQTARRPRAQVDAGLPADNFRGMEVSEHRRCPTGKVQYLTNNKFTYLMLKNVQSRLTLNWTWVRFAISIEPQNHNSDSSIVLPISHFFNIFAFFLLLLNNFRRKYNSIFK